MSHSYHKGSTPMKYSGSYYLSTSVKVAVNCVIFWVDDDSNWFYFKEGSFSRPVCSWGDANEQQQVIDALLEAHRQGGGLTPKLRQPSHPELEAVEKAGNWKIAFFILLIVIIFFIMWLMKGMPDSNQ